MSKLNPFYLQKLKEWQTSPLTYVKECIQTTPTKQQIELLVNFGKQKRSTIRSGHGCHAKGTIIHMYPFGFKLVEDIKVGDRIMGDDGTPRHVLRLYRGKEQMYRIQYHDKTFYDVNESHILSIVCTGNKSKFRTGDKLDISVKDYLKLISARKSLSGRFAGYKVAVDYPEIPVMIPPYILGLWLGDGTHSRLEITNIDSVVIGAWELFGKENGLEVVTSGVKYHRLHGGKSSVAYKAFDYYNLFNNKHIPKAYLFNSKEVRLSLLAGLLDTDGYLDRNNTFSIIQKRRELAEDIQFLAQSCGLHATLTEKPKSWEYKGSKRVNLYYEVNISRNIEIIPTLVRRKQVEYTRTTQRSNLHFGFKVHKLDVDNYYGFEIDGNHRYVLGDFTVTHNTGKDASASWIAQWFLTTRPYAKVVVTAPTNRQLTDIFLSEFTKWMRKSVVSDDFVIQKDTVFHKEAKKEWWLRLVSPSVKATKDEQAETLAGFHGDHLLIIVDEACHDDKTEVLTEDGFKYFAELTGRERVLTKDPSTGVASYVYPTDYHCYDYDGDMYYYKADNLDFAVTPNHKLFYHTAKSSKLRFTKIKDIGKTRLMMPKGFTWIGTDINEFTCFELYQAGWKPFPIAPWLAFLGLFISEGSFSRDANKKITGIVISQQKPKGRFVIEQVLADLGLNYRKYDTEFHISSNSLGEYLQQVCGDGFANKRVPMFVKQLTPDLINIFLDGFCLGDGYFKPDSNIAKGYRRVFYTSSDFLIDDIQELLFKAGYNATIHYRKLANRSTWINDHIATSSKDGYMIAESSTDTELSVRMENVVIKPYKGKVYCLSVPPTELLFTRRNGRCFWSGNSGVPDPVFVPLEGALTSQDNKVLLIGNMTKNTGYFYDTHFHPSIKKDWFRLHWDSRESENVDPSMPAYFARKYGIDSNVFRIRVIGEPPLQDENTLIPLWTAMQCVGQEFEVAEDEPLYLGVDVARYGEDASIILPRKGLKVLPWETFRKLSTIDLGGFVNQTYQDLDAAGVGIDVIGIGAGVYDWLQKRNLKNLYEVNVSYSSSDIEKYDRLRDELWCRVRDNCALGLYSFPDLIPEGETESLGHMLANELATVRYKFNSHGGYKVESKKDLKARGIPSPNIADALCITEYFHNSATRVFKKAKEEEFTSSQGKRYGYGVGYGNAGGNWLGT